MKKDFRFEELPTKSELLEAAERKFLRPELNRTTVMSFRPNDAKVERAYEDAQRLQKELADKCAIIIMASGDFSCLQHLDAANKAIERAYLSARLQTERKYRLTETIKPRRENYSFQTEKNH